MHRKLITALFACAAVLGTAHAQATPTSPPFPPATLAPATDSDTAASLVQWQAMADYQAQRLAPTLRAQPQRWALRTDGPSPFARSYARLLQSALHQQGVLLVPENTPGASPLDVAVDLARFNLDYKPGRLTALTAGLWVMHGIATTLTPAGAATALMLGTDALWSIDGEQPVELAVSLTGIANNVILASQTDVFVVHAHDARLYTTGARHLPLVGR